MDRAQIIHQRISGIAAREREALSELIVELKNLDAIRGYINLGYSSLFDYLTKGLSYSAGAAQRRIDAARLVKDVPNLPEKLEAGTLDLHHVSTVSKAVRQVKKSRAVTSKEKCELFEKLESKSESQTQQTVAEFFNLEVIQETKWTTQQDSSVRIELTISRELAERIERAQGLISHAVPSKDLASFLEYVSLQIIKQKTKALRPKSKQSTAKAALRIASIKSVSQTVHRAIRKAQPTCINCGSAWFPQTDHRKARWLGGDNSADNLQTLCGPCNRAKYYRERQEFSEFVI